MGWSLWYNDVHFDLYESPNTDRKALCNYEGYNVLISQLRAPWKVTTGKSKKEVEE
jgi:hypothetical protein